MRTSRIVATAVLAVLAWSAAACSGRSGTGSTGTDAAPSSTGSATAGQPTPSQPAGGAAGAGLPGGAGSSTGIPGAAGGPLPLWPFRTVAEARAWQQDARAGGHQPWHASAEQTALLFVTGYLGFADVDQVARQELGATDAHVTVGERLPNGRVSPAAVIHLVRFGTGTDAPWEVVGTRDSTLTLTTPAYGAAATSPLRVGGRITGVDESIRVAVRQQAGRPLGESCCTAAGGTGTAWSASVRFAGATSPVLTVVASTGGHVSAVERFAVTGVRFAADRPAGAGSTSGNSAPGRDGDVDGDGRIDSVALAGPGLLRVRYAAGGSDDVRFDATPGAGGQRVLGVADIDRDGRAEVVVRVTGGASTRFASLFRYDGRHLRLVTTGGRQVRLAYGATVTHADSWACGQPSASITTWTGSSTDGSTYRGTEAGWVFDGTALRRTETRPRTVTPDSPAPSGCGSVVLG